MNQPTTIPRSDHTPRRTPPRATRRRALPLLGGVVAMVALAACGDDEAVEDDVRSAVTEASNAVDDAADSVDDEAVEDDVRSAVTEASNAVDEVSEDAVQLAARNLASAQGAEEFDAVGHPLEGDLRCEADASDDLTAVDIECDGVTQDGGVASMTGTTSELPGASITELEGEFAGFVDNEAVFTLDRLGG